MSQPTPPPHAAHPSSHSGGSGSACVGEALTTVGRTVHRAMETVNVPVVRASSVVFQTLEQVHQESLAAAQGEPHRASYATAGTPTTFALIEALEALEGGGHACRAALMPSGLAAISTALLAFCQPGDHVLMTDSVYGPTRVLAQTFLTRMGMEVEFYEPTLGAQIQSRFRPNTRLVYLESPGSFTFEIQDVPAICAQARAHGILTMLDNAWGSPVWSRPFDWGVDISVLPLTKYWSGHADVLMGAAVVRPHLWPALWQTVRQTGVCVGSDDAFLVLRGVRTAHVRMQRHEATALAVAWWLQGRREVAQVLHPALPEHPQHALWKRDFLGSSGLFSFALHAATPDQLAALCERRRYFRIAYSWGGYESLIMPAQHDALRSLEPWQGGPLVRLHCGLEEASALIADLDEGLAAMHTVSGP
jgi:cystathionine beta-lyase